MKLKAVKLKFPLIRKAGPGAKQLSMEDYLRFAQLNLKYIIDMKAYRKQKKALAVNVPFSL